LSKSASRPVELPSHDWSASPVDRAAAWLRRRLDPCVPLGAEVVAVGIGAQGCDSTEHSTRLAKAIGDHGLHAVVVNDAELLVPAAGLVAGIGVIAGTGAIGVGRDATGETLFAGGWGSVIVHQPRLAHAFRRRIGRAHPRLSVRLLDEQPVAGAVALARRLANAIDR